MRRVGGTAIENKAAFVNGLNTLLIEYGNGRYDYLEDEPLTYAPIINEVTGQTIGEIVTSGGECANVYMDSLPAIMKDIVDQGLFHGR